MASDPAHDPAGRVSAFAKFALPLEESGLLIAPCCSAIWAKASGRPHAQLAL